MKNNFQMIPMSFVKIMKFKEVKQQNKHTLEIFIFCPILINSNSILHSHIGIVTLKKNIPTTL